MPEPSIETDLIRKVLRSVAGRRPETAEEIQARYTSLYPPSFLFKGKPSIAIRDLLWALRFLVQKEYVGEEVTRFLEHELDTDTKVYYITPKGLVLTLKKK
jgi:hypothetical protein